MSGRRSLTALVCGLALALIVVSPAAGFAAGAKAPEAGGPLDLQTWVESGQVIIVVAVAVPESTRLPATVRIPVPDGASVQWAGEVLGGDLSADPTRTYKIIKSPAGGQYAEFTLEQTRSAQVDAQLATATVDGANTSATFEWVQSAASPSTSFSVRVPQNASGVKITPAPVGPPQTNPAGESLYAGESVALAPGQKQTVSFSYSTGSSASAVTTPASQLGSLVTALLVALALAVVVLIVAVVLQRRAAVSAAPTAADSRSASDKSKASPQNSSAETSPSEDWGFDDED